MKPIVYKTIFIACCLLAVLQPESFSQRGRARAEIKKLMQEYNAVGLSVAVVKNDKIVYTHAFGLKNIAQRQALKRNDIFRIASISKSFSATAILQLVEAGKLSLDDDISHLVGFTVRNPAYPDVVITLRMVLSHTSSINDSQGYFKLDVINPATNPGYAACYSNYPPGGGYRYCNLNFNMAGAVIEKISGERFDQYVVNHILKPLRLYGGYCIDSLDTSLFATLYEYDSATQKFTAAADAYNPRREEIRNYMPGYSTPVFSPTGGMKISARDLAVYMQMHMNRGTYRGIQIISEKSAQEMQTAVSEAQKYGLALLTTDTFIPGRQLTGHTGSAYGLYSAMFFSPEDKFGLVLITNGCDAAYTNGDITFLKAAAQVLYKNFIE
ncbi:serine hydrolase domain-containing protein [Agriterribacter sp.]|uniref:serine hydrolase domain-containing protein n=1 Tax=Agriterribacter sp. TaxID=2821509 RepID=UPI002C17683F|nr:serine hydrolase domain-containing protein [Agriterribacter sp.]HRO45132.1 serine hydrolase domain-containing protein [Agriterribacter sp.]